MNSSHDCDVVVLGAGPTGLTLANLLGKAGLQVTLVERNFTTVQAPRAVSIDDEALRTIQAAGLIEPVLRDIVVDYGYQYITSNNVVFAQIEPTAREYGWPRRNAFTQPELEATLRAGLDRYANVVQLFGHSCETVVEDRDGVTLSLKNADGATSILRTRYLAGCDGGRSAIRKLLGAEMTGSTYLERWLIVDLAETRERFRLTRVICDPRRPTICLPGPDGKRRYEFMVHHDETEDAISTESSVRELLGAFGPDRDAPIVRKQVYTFHARIADRWSSRRIFIGGDAAHLTPPFAGQGMNSGVRDAHNLGWKLSAVVRGEFGPGLLATYQTEREPHARALVDMAVNIGKVMMPTSAVQAFLIQTAFRLMRLVPPLHAYFAQMKYKPKPFYAEGFLIADDGGLNIVGRMQPQPILERLDRTRDKLDDIVGNDFVLLAFGDEAQAALSACSGEDFAIPHMKRIAVTPHSMNIDREASVVIEACREVDGLFESILPPGRDILILIRPDRYAAAACDVSDRRRIPAFAERVRALVAGTNVI